MTGQTGTNDAHHTVLAEIAVAVARLFGHVAVEGGQLEFRDDAGLRCRVCIAGITDDH